MNTLDHKELQESKDITEKSLVKWSEDMKLEPGLNPSRLVFPKIAPKVGLLNQDVVNKKCLHVFNTHLQGFGPKKDHPGPRVDQCNSGRCWLFATTNVLRYRVIVHLKLGDFQISGSHLFFYDKLEKASLFLGNMIEHADEPYDGRVMDYLLQNPACDGGHWDMAINLIEKYGCVPLAICPETHSSNATAQLNRILNFKLREFSFALRSAVETQSTDSIGKMKEEMMAQIYRTLTITLGQPPHPDEPFTWEYYDRDGEFGSWAGTPKDFYSQFCQREEMKPKDYVTLMHDPRKESGKLYVQPTVGNIKGLPAMAFVTAPIETLEEAVIAGIKANTLLFFECDSDQSMDSTKGVADVDLYDYKAAYGFGMNMTKAQRLESRESVLVHAMVFTAVHLDDHGRPVRYRVENSWGESKGDKGWFMVTAEWFREYVYAIAVPRSIVDEKVTAAYDKNEPILLKPWDRAVALRQ